MNAPLLDIHTHVAPSATAIYSLQPDDSELAVDTNLLFSAGIHPWDATLDAEQWSKIEQLAKRDNVVAIGEAGIDKRRSPLALSDQIELLRRHAILAETARKPLLLHVVGAWNEIIALHRELKPRQLWIVHGFRGKAQLARSLRSHGIRVSFGEHYNPAALRSVPLDELLIETDESTLGVDAIIDSMARTLDIAPATLRDSVSRNAQCLCGGTASSGRTLHPNA